jgi:hypothetical protein
MIMTSARKHWVKLGFGTCAAIALFCLSASASANTHQFMVPMNGAQETPPNSSTATGSCTATLDDVTGAVTFSGTFSGLAANATAAHIHGLAGPGVAAAVLIPATSVTAATDGTFSGSGTLSAANVTGMLAGQTYCNVHDATFPSGEIRGQLVGNPVPALPLPLVGLLALALAGAGAWAARRRLTFGL